MPLATDGDEPKKIRTGHVIKESPPAMVLIKPATKPASVKRNKLVPKSVTITYSIS